MTSDGGIAVVGLVLPMARRVPPVLVIVTGQHPDSTVKVSHSLHHVSYGIHCNMFEVKRTDTFDGWLKGLDGWLKGLQDSKGRTRIQARIDRLANGNPGDVAPIGEGLSELRIDFGPGYRVYYGRTGKTIYLLLCGGDKGTQVADIKNAHDMWKVLNLPAKKPGK